MFDRFEPANNIKIPSTCHLPHREQSHPQQANKTLDRNGYRRSVSFDVQLKDDYPILEFFLELKLPVERYLECARVHVQIFR
jgi:hypothetical protein